MPTQKCVCACVTTDSSSVADQRPFLSFLTCNPHCPDGSSRSQVYVNLEQSVCLSVMAMPEATLLNGYNVVNFRYARSSTRYQPSDIKKMQTYHKPCTLLYS